MQVQKAQIDHTETRPSGSGKKLNLVSYLSNVAKIFLPHVFSTAVKLSK